MKNRRNLTFYLVWVPSYLVLALAASFPVLRSPGGMIPADAASDPDVVGTLWTHWLADLQGFSLFFHTSTDLFRYPFHENLFYKYFNFLDAMLAIPLRHLFGFPFYYTILVWLLIIAGACAGAALARQWCDNDLVAGFAGALYAFNPYLTQTLKHGQIFLLLALVFVPLFFLALEFAWRRGGLFWPIAAGGLIALAGLSYWYYGMFLFLFAGLFVLVRGWPERYRLGGDRWLSLALVLLVGVVLSMLFVGTVFSGEEREESWRILHPAPLPSPAVIDSADSPEPWLRRILGDSCSLEYPLILGGYIRKGQTQLQTDSSRNLSLVLVLVALYLGLAQWWTREGPRPSFWVLAGLVAYVLSLGPYLKYAGVVLIGSGGGGVALPYSWLYRFMPLFSRFNWPSRFVPILVLCLTIALAVYLSWMARRMKLGRGMLGAILLVILGLCWVEMFVKAQLPLPAGEVEIPRIYYQLAADPSGAVLEVPPGKFPRARLYQVIHHHPSSGGELGAGGFISIQELQYRRFLSQTPFLRALWVLAGWPVEGGAMISGRQPGVKAERKAGIVDSTALAWRWLDQDSLVPLQKAGFRYLAVHRGGFGGKARQGDETYASVVAALERRLGLPLYSSAQLTLFELKPDLPPKSSPGQII